MSNDPALNNNNNNVLHEAKYSHQQSLPFTQGYKRVHRFSKPVYNYIES